MHYLLAQQHAGVLHPRHPQLFAHAVPSNFRTLALLSASEPRTQPHGSDQFSRRTYRSRPKSRSEHEHSAHTAFERHAKPPGVVTCCAGSGWSWVGTTAGALGASSFCISHTISSRSRPSFSRLRLRDEDDGQKLALPGTSVLIGWLTVGEAAASGLGRLGRSAPVLEDALVARGPPTLTGVPSPTARSPPIACSEHGRPCFHGKWFTL